MAADCIYALARENQLCNQCPSLGGGGELRPRIPCVLPKRASGVSIAIEYLGWIPIPIKAGVSWSAPYVLLTTMYLVYWPLDGRCSMSMRQVLA